MTTDPRIHSDSNPNTGETWWSCASEFTDSPEQPAFARLAQVDGVWTLTLFPEDTEPGEILTVEDPSTIRVEAGIPFEDCISFYEGDRFLTSISTSTCEACSETVAQWHGETLHICLPCNEECSWCSDPECIYCS